MEMSGEYRIPAPRERVWDALNDPEILKLCIPGSEELRKLSDTEFTAKVTAKVGAIKATFTGSVTLSDIDAPNSYTIAGQGQWGAASFAKGSARVTLVPDGGATILCYRANAEVGGKLANVGSRLVQGVARKTADDFFGSFAQIVGGEAGNGAPAPRSLAATAASAAHSSVPTLAWVGGLLIIIVLLLLLLR